MITFTLFSANCAITYLIVRLLKTSQINKTWSGVDRHIFVLIVACFAFPVEVGLMMLLDRFEMNNFSYSNLLTDLQLPWMLSAAGLSLLMLVLTLFKAPYNHEA